MQHHVVMPFSRPQHADLYARHLKDAEVVWHPIVEGVIGSDWLYSQEEWVRPFRSGTIPDGSNACYTKLNRFIDHVNNHNKGLAEEMTYGSVKRYRPEEEHYYTFLTDDNWWHIEYWKQLQWHMTAHKKPIILANQLRCGNAIKAAAENMRCCLFDISTLTVRGDVLREMRFEEHLWFADGLMAEQLRQRYGPDGIGIADGAWMYYNMLDPRSWGYTANTVTA